MSFSLLLLPSDISKNILLKWYFPYVLEELKIITIDTEDKYYVENFPDFSMVYQRKMIYENNMHILRNYVMSPRTMNILNRNLDKNRYI